MPRFRITTGEAQGGDEAQKGQDRGAAAEVQDEEGRAGRRSAAWLGNLCKAADLHRLIDACVHHVMHPSMAPQPTPQAAIGVMCHANTGAEGEGGSGSDADGEAPVKPTNKASKPAAAPAAAVPEPTTDVSAWDVFGLHPGILRALAMQVCCSSYAAML